MTSITTKRAIAMELVAPAAENGKFVAQFVANLKKRCVKLSTVLAVLPGPTGISDAAIMTEGVEYSLEVFWNAKLGFWFCHRTLEDGHSLCFGMDDPREHARLHSLYELTIPASGFDRKAGGALVRFGNDVFLAHSARTGAAKRTVDKDRFSYFVALHEYDLIQASVELPGDKSVAMIMLSSTSDTNAGLNMYKFIRAVRDYEQWLAWDLLRPQERGHGQASLQPDADGFLPPLSEAASLRMCGHRACTPLHNTVVSNLREHLEKSLRTRGLACPMGVSAQHDILVFAPNGAAAAVFQVKTDITPQSLFGGAGELLLSRAALQARKVLVVPQNLGPFFTQALHRQGIEVSTYIFTDKGIVFIDIDRVLESIAHTV